MSFVSSVMRSAMYSLMVMLRAVARILASLATCSVTLAPIRISGVLGVMPPRLAGRDLVVHDYRKVCASAHTVCLLAWWHEWGTYERKNGC